MNAAAKVCVIIGAGPGNGASLARRFAGAGYRLALCARNVDFINRLAGELDGAEAFAYDASDAKSAAQVLPAIAAALGPIDTLIYNAGAGTFGSLDKITAEDFEHAWRVNALGLFAAAKQVVPAMRERGGGTIIVIGATASIKHGANFTAFTSAKSAQRAMAQSLARHLGRDRIHVGYVIIDGVIDLERTRKVMTDKPDEFFLKPDAIADAVYFLARQDPSAWTFELDLRPFGERW